MVLKKLLQRTNVNSQKLIVLAFYFLCFLFGLDFLGLTKYLFFAITFLFLLYSFLVFKFRVDRWFCFVVLFSIFLTIFGCINYGFSLRLIAYYFLLPILAYLFGYNLCVEASYIPKGRFIFNVFFSIFCGFVLYAFLGMCVTAYSFGFFPLGRRFLAVWSTTFSEVNVTLIQYQIIPISCVAPIIIFIKSPYKKKYHVVISIVALIFSIYLGFVLQCRTFVLCLIFILLATPFIVLLQSKNKIVIRLAIGFLIIGVASFISFYFLLIYNTAFQNAIFSIPLLRRIFSSEFNSNNQRFGLWEYFFKYFYRFPFGGFPMIENPLDDLCVSHYFHNYWLDIYRVGGMIPFLIVLFFTIRTIVLLFKNKKEYLNNDSFLFYFLVMSFAGLLIFAMFEPVYDMNPYFAVLIFVFFGISERSYFNIRSFYPFSKKIREIEKENFKIVFISNFLSMHTIPIHDAFVKKYSDRYCFIATTPINEAHKSYGYKTSHDNILRYYDMLEKDKCEKVLTEADIIIGGCVSTRFICKYLNKQKLFVACSERIFRKNPWERWSVKSCLSYFKNFFPLQLKTNNLCLSLSRYTSLDLDQLNYCSNQTYEWAYLTKLGMPPSTFKPNTKIKIVFVNRLIELKHPEMAISLGSYLKKNNYDFHIDIVGTGPLEQSLKNLVGEKQLDEFVTVRGFLKNDEVNDLLLQSDILISCSNSEEGWGATINEGLNNGCAVVASNTCGAANVLIKDMINGLVFDFLNTSSLFKKIEYLIQNPQQLETMKKNAYSIMLNERNPDTYVSRFDLLIKSILERKVDYFQVGPVSKQRPVSEIETSAAVKKINNSQKKTHDKQKRGTDLGLKGGTIISYFTILFTIATGFIFTPWLLRVLGESNYAIYSLATSLISMFAIDFGLGAAVSRFISKYRAEKNIESSNRIIGLIFKAFLILDVLIFVVLFVLFFFINNIYHALSNDEINAFKIVYIIAGLYSLISFEFTPLNGILMGNSKFPQYKLIALISKIFYFILSLIVLTINGNLFLYVLVVAFSGIVEMTIKIAYIKTRCEYGSKPIFKKTKDNRGILLSLIKYSIWAAIASICSRFIISMNQNILGIFAGTLQITFFAVGCQIEGYVWQFSNALDGMFMPILSKMNVYNASSDDYTRMMIKVGRIQLLLIGLILIGFICLGNNFINQIWMKNESISYTTSYWVAFFLILPAFFTYTHQIGKSTLLVKGKNKYYAFGMIISAVLSTALCFLFCAFMPQSAAILSALGICVAKMLGLVIYMSFCYKKYGDINILTFYLKCHVRYIPVAAIVLAIGLMLDYFLPSSFLYFAIKVILIVILYIVLSWLIFMNKEEKKMLLDQIKKISSFLIRTFEKDGEEQKYKKVECCELNI